MFGSLITVRASEVASYNVGAHYYVGELPVWQLIWYHFSGHPILIACFAALMMVIVTIVLWQYYVKSRLSLRKNRGGWTMKKLMFLLSLLLSPQLMAATCEWPQWSNFKSIYIENGRVIDGSDERLITTSEGQSSAFVFALVANDQQTFDQVLKWIYKRT